MFDIIISENTLSCQDNKIKKCVRLYDLYTFLGLTWKYSDFCKHYLKKYEKGVDFDGVMSDQTGLKSAKKSPDKKGDIRNNYIITIQVAKEICLMSETETGKQYRKYLIDVEENFSCQLQKQTADLQEENKQLKQILKQNSIDFTINLIETNKIKEEKKSKSNYYEQIEEIDIFGNKNIKYQYIPRDKELLYKLDCCENTAKGCIINGNKYINELKEMGILITKSLFILPHHILA